VLVTVNGRERHVPEGATVEAVLSALLAEGAGERHRGIAVAVQGEVVPQSRWGSTAVPAGAVIEVLTAVQGG
jgi:sulfur carrier protein